VFGGVAGERVIGEDGSRNNARMHSDLGDWMHGEELRFQKWTLRGWKAGRFREPRTESDD
jgi:hypothetical protein